MSSKIIWAVTDKAVPRSAKRHAFDMGSTFGAENQVGAACNYRLRPGFNKGLGDSPKCSKCLKTMGLEPEPKN